MDENRHKFTTRIRVIPMVTGHNNQHNRFPAWAVLALLIPPFMVAVGCLAYRLAEIESVLAAAARV